MSKGKGRTGRRGDLERKLAAYAMAGGALVVGTAGEAEAGIITVPIGQTIGNGGGQASSYTLSLSGEDLVTFTADNGSNGHPIDAEILAASSSNAAIVITGQFGTDATALVAGDTVGPSSNFSGSPSIAKLLAAYSQTQSPLGEFAGVSNASMGISFTDPSNPLQTDYGYIAVSVTATPDATLATATISSFTYDNTGAAITIGAVPEPASLAMLATGAAGVGAFLSQRKRKATA